MSPFGGMGGLLYQPGTAQYQQAFPMNEGILRYQPPQLGLIPVSYSNPYALNFEMMEEGGEEDSGSKKPKSSDDGLTDLDQRGGPDRGPGSSSHDGKGVDSDGRSSGDLGMGKGGGADSSTW